MTFNKQAQLESLHIAAFPYQSGFGEPDTLCFEDANNNIAAARVYAINSGAVTLFTSIGVPYDECLPMLYNSINTTDKGSKTGYDMNGEQSWGILKLIEGGWPEYIPKVEGTFVPKKTVQIADLYDFAAGYDPATGNSTVAMP